MFRPVKAIEVRIWGRSRSLPMVLSVAVAVISFAGVGAEAQTQPGDGRPQATVPAVPPVAAVARMGELSVLWKAEIGKSIVASPAVSGGSVFVADQGGRLTSLDIASGKQQWQTDLGAPLSASPLVADDVVYVGDEQGKFHAVAASSGKDRVLLTAGDKIVGQAALREGVIYVGAYDRYLYAIDIASGRKLWSFETGAQVNAAPVIAGDTVLVAGCDAKVRALDAKTGKERWAVDVDGPVAATPLVADGRVFAATLKGDRVAIDPAAGKLLWKNREQADADGGASFMASPVIPPNVVDCVQFTAQSGQALWHDMASGKWQSTSFVPGRVSATPALWQGSFYYATEEGKLYGPRRTKGGAGLWFTAGGGIKAAPVAAGERLLVCDEDGAVWCLLKPAGKVPAKAK